MAQAAVAALSVGAAAAPAATAAPASSAPPSAPGVAHASSLAVTAPRAYSLLTSDGRLIGYGGAFSATVATPASPVVGVASTPDGRGAYAAEADGEVIALGDAVFQGSLVGTRLSKPIVGIAIDPSTGGYWLVASDGGIFDFGGARFYGSTGSTHLNKPVVGMAATSDGQGYWLVASDGGVFTFGDAGFYGSTGAVHLNKPVVGMAATATGHGYWMVASDGGIFTFGDAGFYGSTGSVRLNRPVIAMSPTGTGQGYWLEASDGGIFDFGDATFYGSGAGAANAFVGMAIGVGDGYANPMRAVSGLRPERVDEGVDYGGSGPVYALGDGVVTSTSGSWPDGTFISYRLTAGPAAGKMVYVAENVTPTVTVGQTVNLNTVVGILHDSYPDMEIGWAADSYGDTMAASAGQWTSADDSASLPSAYGVNFDQLLVSLGATPGVMEHPNVTGTLAAGWPGW
ncbi:hypothetical protein K6U06_17685 [Acidiferrimicrobium sp. IK]|uniref:hypothetical protein n=1 Tax=Acidiferrimicrobium sp. IK TaxID=2871700 RepID=UPI0021CB5A70|nr:hypothetical protein [Acidiferrimicrobium sp. IK]MCU4186202.1 hypothetical protein [Acidiferrimicrobium sp. IK]